MNTVGRNNYATDKKRHGNVDHLLEIIMSMIKKESMEMLDNYWENTSLGRNNYVNDKRKVMEMLDNDWENTWLV